MRILLSHSPSSNFVVHDYRLSPKFIENGIYISASHPPCCVWVITKAKRKLLSFDSDSTDLERSPSIGVFKKFLS